MADKKTKITLATKFVNSQIRLKKWEEALAENEEVIAALKRLKDRIDNVIIEIENCEFVDSDTGFITSLLDLAD